MVGSTGAKDLSFRRTVNVTSVIVPTPPTTAKAQIALVSYPLAPRAVEFEG